jgi:hypothetical protein
MGGNAFTKTMTKVVDPFNLSPKLSKSWVGKSMRAINKVVDPLNIMDPMGVLPTSWAAGKTPFVLDKTYGGAAQKWLGINQGGSSYAPMTKGLSRDPQYFAQQQQMLANMSKQQQAKLANLRTQGEIYPAGTTVTTQVSQSPQATTPAPSTTALAQTKVGDTTSPSDILTEFIYKPSTKTTKSATANVFQIPDMSNIKFGGV